MLKVFGVVRYEDRRAAVNYVLGELSMSQKALIAAVVLAIGAASAGFGFLWAQQGSSQQGSARQPMRAAIATVPGYLGMKQARTGEGTDLSLIWFADKNAVPKWYEGDAHQEVITKYFGDVELREPLADIADDTGPLLVIASFTQAKEPQKRLPLFSQFAIEIFEPLKGGLFISDTMAPEEARARGLREFRD